MNPFYQALSGGIGGLIRSLVGISKAYTTNPRTFIFDWKYFAFSLFVSVLTGMMAGVVLNSDWRMSLLAGYAGSDFLEGLYKVKFTQMGKTVTPTTVWRQNNQKLSYLEKSFWKNTRTSSCLFLQQSWSQCCRLWEERSMRGPSRISSLLPSNPKIKHSLHIPKKQRSRESLMETQSN